MSRIPVPSGYTSWNSYIRYKQNTNPNQSIAALRLLKRNIKLDDEAEIERKAGGDKTSPSYRTYNTYVSPGTVAPTIARPWTKTTITAGLWRKTVQGYFNDKMNYFDYAINLNESVDTGQIDMWSGRPADDFSIEWIGYFKAATTENYTFVTISDDASYLWIGDDAVYSYNVRTALVNNGGTHGTQTRTGTIPLVANTYYPIRIMYGDFYGNERCTVRFSTPTLGSVTDWTNYSYYNPDTRGF